MFIFLILKTNQDSFDIRKFNSWRLHKQFTIKTDVSTWIFLKKNPNDTFFNSVLSALKSIRSIEGKIRRILNIFVVNSKRTNSRHLNFIPIDSESETEE